jgi:putative ABC transport system permease protein
MEIYIAFDNTLNQTLVYCFLAVSVYISLRLIDFPDLSIEGTFPLGAAIAVVVAKYVGMAALSIPLAIMAGFLFGAITAILHLYLKMGKLLAGILTSVGLYSINFRIMGANANLYLSPDENLFSFLRKIDTQWINSIVPDGTYALAYPFSNATLLISITVVMCGLYLFLKTEIGSLVRYSRTDTQYFFQSIGINHKVYIVFGLGLANAFAALSGVLAAYSSGSASITIGMGIILVALVSLVIGEQIVRIFHKDLTDIFPTILAPFFGTFIYFLIIWVIRWANTQWQAYSGYQDPANQLQFFNADIKILSAVIMICIYIFKRKDTSSLNIAEGL